MTERNLEEAYPVMKDLAEKMLAIDKIIMDLSEVEFRVYMAAVELFHTNTLSQKSVILKRNSY